MNYDQRPQYPAQDNNGPAPRRESNLQIDSESIMAEIPRGKDGKEVLRFTFTKATTADGKQVAWHSLRVFYKDHDGTWKPGRQGVTIRGKEFGAIATAFAKGPVPYTPHTAQSPRAPAQLETRSRATAEDHELDDRSF